MWVQARTKPSALIGVLISVPLPLLDAAFSDSPLGSVSLYLCDLDNRLVLDVELAAEIVDFTPNFSPEVSKGIVPFACNSGSSGEPI